LATVATSAISDTTGVSAVSGGNITSDGGSAVTARGIVWGTSPSPTVSLATKTADGSGSGQFSSRMEGLSKGTKYYVRAYATNAAGTAYGNEVSFTTLNVDITSDLVLYLPFNGNANDQSGNNNNGIVNGSVLTSDRNGNPNSAYFFDGINDYINIQSSSSLNMGPGTSFSITFYYKPETVLSQNNGFNGLIGKMYPTNGTGPINNGWQIGRSLTSLRFQSRSGASNNPGINLPCPGNDNIGDLNSSLFDHYAFIFDRVNGKLNYYKNAILVQTVNCQELNGDFSNNYSLKIGVEREGSFYSSGKIDEVRIYKRLLDLSEINYLSKN
jgi:hypothetical protein